MVGFNTYGCTISTLIFDEIPMVGSSSLITLAFTNDAMEGLIVKNFFNMPLTYCFMAVVSCSGGGCGGVCDGGSEIVGFLVWVGDRGDLGDNG